MRNWEGLVRQIENTSSIYIFFFQYRLQFKHVVIKRIIDTFFLSHRVFILQIVSFDWSLYFVLLTYWAHFSLLLTKNIVPPAKKNKVICKLLLHNTVESYFVVWYKIIFHSTAKWGYKQKIFAINSANIFFQEIVSLALTL